MIVVFHIAGQALAAFAAAFAALRYGGFTKIQAIIIGWLAGLTIGVAVHGWPL
jgi:hypothetical protein